MTAVLGGALVVAYVGNFTPPQSTEHHLARALAALGHRVIPLQEDDARTWAWLNDPRRWGRDRPDLVMWTRTWALPTYDQRGALARLEAEGIATLGFHLDRWWGLNREHQIAEEPFFRCAVVATADGGNDGLWERAGVDHVWSPPGVAAEFCGRPEHCPPTLRGDIAFVGSHPYPHREWEPVRSRMIETLTRVFGDRFRVWPGRDRRRISGSMLSALYAGTKVVVGDSCLVRGATRYWSDRIPETLARGAFLVHPEVVGMEPWYDQRHLATFPVGDNDALVDIVRAALEDPERRLGAGMAGAALVAARDTYTHRIDALLALLAQRGKLRRAA